MMQAPVFAVLVTFVYFGSPKESHEYGEVDNYFYNYTDFEFLESDEPTPIPSQKLSGKFG